MTHTHHIVSEETIRFVP